MGLGGTRWSFKIHYNCHGLTNGVWSRFFLNNKNRKKAEAKPYELTGKKILYDLGNKVSFKIFFYDKDMDFSM